WDELKPQLSEDITTMSANLRELLRSDPHLADENLETARLELLRARRSALNELRASNIISEDAFETVAVELDQALTQTGNQDPEVVDEPDAPPMPAEPMPETPPDDSQAGDA
ncbi:MAG: hypothetical protein IH587_05550, partial [Anaerolineae bacterium]|nr:hypothetical protein [Anaerolineae bacterium]